MPRYWLTPTANRHYQKAVSDTRLKWGLEQAKRYRAALRAGFQHIAEQPQALRSPHREALAEGTDFALHLVERHYVAFQPWRDGVVIVAVFHASMDIPNRLRQLQALTREEIQAIKTAIATTSQGSSKS